MKHNGANCSNYAEQLPLIYAWFPASSRSPEPPQTVLKRSCWADHLDNRFDAWIELTFTKPCWFSDNHPNRSEKEPCVAWKTLAYRLTETRFVSPRE